MKIFVFGYYGYRNVGDDAMGMATYLGLKYKGHDVTMFYKGDGMVKTFKNVLESDAVAIGGGTHLRNWGKKWWYCSGRVLLLGIICRVLFKKFYMINVGSGGKRLDWIARRISTKVTQRDTDTMDSALLLNYVLRRKENVLGINLQSISSIYYDDYDLDEQLMKAICNTIGEWRKSHTDWQVVFISFNGHEYFPDDAINETAASMTGSQFYPYHYDTMGLLSDMSRLKAFIGMRYHSLVFAYMTETPFIAIQTYPRCKVFNSAINNPIEPITMFEVIDGKLLGQLHILTHHQNLTENWLPLQTARVRSLRGLDV